MDPEGRLLVLVQCYVDMSEGMGRICGERGEERLQTEVNSIQAKGRLRFIVGRQELKTPSTMMGKGNA